MTGLAGLPFKLDFPGHLSRAAFVGFAMFPPNTETFVNERVRLKFHPNINSFQVMVDQTEGTSVYGNPGCPDDWPATYSPCSKPAKCSYGKECCCGHCYPR